MGSAPSTYSIQKKYEKPIEIVEYLRTQGGLVSEERCLKTLCDIRWMIILLMDTETNIVKSKGSSRCMKKFEWKSFVAAEVAASKKLYEKRGTINEKNMNECVDCYRQLYDEMVIHEIPQKLSLESDETVYFSSVSIGRGKGVDAKFKEPNPSMDEIFQEFIKSPTEGMDRNIDDLIRQMTEKILSLLGRSIQAKRNNIPCMYEVDKKRYEKELKRVLKATPNEAWKSILIQYRKQLQICISYIPKEMMSSENEKKRLAEDRIHVLPDDTNMLSEKESLDMKKGRAANELRRQHISLILKNMEDTSSNKTEEERKEEMALLMKIYHDELKLLYNINIENSLLPFSRETYLEEKLESKLEEERKQSKPRDVKMYKETLEKALDSETVTSDGEDSYQRGEIIVLDMEIKRWQELIGYSEERSCVQDLAELGSDFDTSYQTESEMIEGITQAQAAIMTRVPIKKNTSDNDVKVTRAQVIKDQVTECKERESEYRKFVHSQINSAKEKLANIRRVSDGSIYEEEVSESDEEYLGEISKIEKELDDRYDAIERIGETLDESDEDIDSDNDEGRKQEEGIKQLEENVEKIQKLVIDLRKVKYGILNKLNEGFSKLTAEITGLKKEFIVFAEEMKKLRSDLTKRNTDHGKRMYKRLVEKVEQFDKERFQKLTSRRLSPEEEEVFRKLVARDREEVIKRLEKIMDSQEKMIKEQTPRKPGLSSMMLTEAKDVHEFLRNRAGP